MRNGTDQQLCGDEHSPTAESASDSGREIVIESGSNSTSGAPLPNSPSLGIEPPSEWDTYIDTQTRNGWDDLGHDEKAFCEEYLSNGYNHRAAAESVERSPNSGIKLLHRPLCREYLLWLEQKRQARSIITERFLEAQYLSLLDEADGQIEVAIVTGAGSELLAKKYNGPLKLSILQEMSKMSGITKPDENSKPVNVIIDMGALTGAEHKPKVISEQ